jgi:hypothetical protein
MEFLLADTGAVAAQAPEHGADGVLVLDDEIGVVGEARVAHVVVDAEGEVVLHGPGLEMVVKALDHPGVEFLGRQAVAAAVNARHGEGQLVVDDRFHDRRGDVQVKGFALGAGFLGLVEHGDLLDGLGEGLEEEVRGEGPEEPDLQHAHLLAPGVQVIHHFGDGLATGAHHDDHAVGLGVAVIIVNLVLAAGELGVAVHFLLHDAGNLLVEGVDGLPRLEVDVGVLGRAADERVVGGEAAFAVLVDKVQVDHAVEHVVRDQLHFLDFVGGAEPIEEMDEGHPRTQRARLGDGGHVHGLLDAVGRQDRPARLADGHDVLVVVKNGEALGRDGPGRDVEDGGGQLARDLVHVWGS